MTIADHPSLDPDERVSRIGLPDDDDVACGVRPAPCLDPEVEHVMEVDVCQQRRCTAALWRSLLGSCSLPLLQHAGVQPFLDEAHDGSGHNPVLDESHEPAVVERIEDPTDVHVEHPGHLLRQHPRVERVQRVVLTA